MDTANASDPAMPPPDLPLRGCKPQPEHSRDDAAGWSRWRRWRRWRRRRRWRRWRRWRRRWWWRRWRRRRRWKWWRWRWRWKWRRRRRWWWRWRRWRWRRRRWRSPDRDQDPARVEHGPCRGYARAVDVDLRVRAPVLPGREVVRAIEGQRRVVLQVHGCRNWDPRRVEHRPGRGDPCAIDVRRDLGAPVVPDGQIVRAVESDGRRVLPTRRRRDSESGGVEHNSGRCDPRPIDVDVAGTAVLPSGEVVCAVKGERDVLLETYSCRDRDPGRIENGAGRGNARAVDVGVG